MVSDALLTLRRWLEASDFKHGERLPSERLLARQLGLKHNAINRAMARLLAEGLVQRDGYKLSYAGDGTSAACPFTCDLVLARRSFYSRSYLKTAKELGIGLRIHYYESMGEVLNHFHALDVPETECVLFDAPHVLPASLWESALRRLITHGIPAVSIRQHSPDIPCVQTDYARAVELAFSHLRDSGHREMALVSTSPRAPSACEIVAAWQSLRLQRGFRASSERIALYHEGREDDVRMIIEKLEGAWKSVSALAVYSDWEPIVPHLLEALAQRKRCVPKDLAVICLGDLPNLATTKPPVSTAAIDVSFMQESVFHLAQRLARKKQDMGILAPFPRVLIQPHLILRGSTRPLIPAKAGKRTSAAGLAAPIFPVGQNADTSPAELSQNLENLIRRPYTLAAHAEESRFVTVSLDPFVNRPLNFRKGWLGDLPLAHFAAGKHKIHGVPFQVLGGHSRKDCGAIVFRSMANKTGKARSLPSRVRVPIGTRALSIYILHGCGYSRFLAPFARYDFFAGSKRLGSVPLVALGYPPPGCDAEQFEREARKANIQDWWPDFPHIDFPDARRVPVMEVEAADANRHVFLYTLEWKNPFPRRKVTHMEITVDSGQPTTLGVVAVSFLAAVTKQPATPSASPGPVAASRPQDVRTSG